ncbi:MAG: hypothetical protein ACRDT6_13055 [Micromonosporaceae bacterium]
MAVPLLFNLADALELAEHALATPQTPPSVCEHPDGVTRPGALAWVKDDGTYLISGAQPRLPADPADPHGPARVVYADGHGPGENVELLAARLGGDDFVEHVDLRGGYPPLIDLMREARQLGYRWLVIIVRRDTFGIGFAGGPRAAPPPGCRGRWPS